MRQLWILVGAVFAISDYVKSQDTGRNLYSSRYDHLNVESILSSSRLVTNYVDCLLNKKPCPPEGKDLKRILPEALRTKCSRCSPKQKENALKIIRKLYEDYPTQYQALRAKWDQTGEYHRRFENYLREEQFNSINSNDRRPRPTQSPVANVGGDSNRVDQTQLNSQLVPLSAIPQTTQRAFTPRPAVVTAPPAPPQTQRPAPAIVVPQNRPVQNQNQIPIITRVVPQEQQQPSNGNTQNNAPAQNLLPNQAQTQRPDRSPLVPQNTNQNTVASQPEPTVSLSSRFGDEDDEDQQPPAPAITSSISSVPAMQPAAAAPPPTSINTNTNQNTQTIINTNTNTDGLVNVNDIRTPSATIQTSATVVGIPPNIIDNFFVPPSIVTYQPPIHGLFTRIGSKVVNTAAFVGGMLKATVQVFDGNPQQQQYQ